MQQPAQELRLAADREKRGVALYSLLAALGLTLTKLLVGLWTNSLGILAEAAHSALDLAAAGMTLWAVRVSAQPADLRHTYGHGKFENLSALLQTVLLLLTCGWIIYEAVRRLGSADPSGVKANLAAFLVVVLSIVVDYSRARALGRAARKHHSQALEADALHFATDVWSSLVVLLGLGAVALKDSFRAPWLEKADAVAALGVAQIVVWITLRLGKRSIDELLDSVPHELQGQVAASAASVPGVEAVKQVRLRRSGPDTFADVTLCVDHAATFEKTHQIADQAEAAIRSLLPRADVVIHVEPVAGPGEDLLTTVRLAAARHGLAAHAVRLYEEAGGRPALELHLEVGQFLSLEEAHRQATAFEEELRNTVGQTARIVTHLEPAGDPSAPEKAPARDAEAPAQLQVRQAIEEFLARSPTPLRTHDLTVQSAGGELQVSLHCTLEGCLAITAAHELTERLESYLRARVPSLGRVLIHVEPGESSQQQRGPL
ncbi:MAG: cation diffusion facilitator family transporter [Thermoguttaceae bacterium]